MVVFQCEQPASLLKEVGTDGKTVSSFCGTWGYCYSIKVKYMTYFLCLISDKNVLVCILYFYLNISRECVTVNFLAIIPENKLLFYTPGIHSKFSTKSRKIGQKFQFV